MAEIQDLTIVDASNTARFPENQAPSSVNDGARALEGIVARYHRDTNASKASTGSANAYVFAANQTLSAYYDGLTIAFDANFTNPGAATLNVDAVSADAIVWPDQTALVAGDIVSGSKVVVIHDGASWQLQTRSALGTAAILDTGVADGNVIVADATGLPVIDGSQLTGLNIPSTLSEITTLETEQATTSGTAKNFTGIASTTRRITIMFAGVSTNGTDDIIVQIGDSGGIEASGYLGAAAVVVAASAPAIFNLSTGFGINMTAVTNVIHGSMTLTLEDSANDTWASTHAIGSSAAARVMWGGGTKSLTSTLDRIRITTVGGTDAFDAGAVNILIE